MSPKNLGSESPRPKFHRVKAYCDAQQKNLDWFFRQLTCSSRHARLVLLGDRKGSARLLDSMRDALGPAGWAYATRVTNVLDAADAPAAEGQS